MLRLAVALWLSAVVLRLVFAWFTLAHTPAIYPDEVMVADYGRNIFEYPAESSVVWSFATDSPRVPVYWLGCAAMEWVCRLSGDTPIGARMLGVVASLVAATFLLLWMRASGVGWRVSLVGSTAFMLDPLYVAVSRSGRPDTLVMAFALAACWLVRSAATRRQAGDGSWWRFAAAGMLAGVTPFLWPSAVFLLLLVASELLRMATAHKGTWKEAFHGAIGPWIAFGIGGVIAAALLALPLRPMWPEAMKQFFWLSEVAASAGTLGDWRLFLHSFRVDPLLLAAVATSALVLWRRDWLLVLTVAVTTLFLVQSLVYHFRAGYALPSYYALVITACAVWTV
ncbi:MAG: glycosyltransferase family 39 protein, partial [Chthoniobacterales bacterium]